MTVTCPACSFRFNETAKADRSTPEHRRYFGMIKAAFDNWPIKHQFQPLDSAALRIFLQCRAGAVEAIQAPTGQIYLIPRSIEYQKMPHNQFHQLHERVSRIIGEVIGVSGDELLAKQTGVA
tara:strand:- start:3572 stop:3937 length:366 start_codon:yes stop_codon:yes gene_type:complete